jgi:WD40-like Beta Propeller Repeat
MIVGAGCFGEVEHGNVAFDVLPDGRRIVFSAVDGDLYLFHLESQNVEELIRTNEIDSAPAFAPDCRSIVFTVTGRDDKSNLAILALDHKRGRIVTNQEGTADSSPAFSRDGKQITFVRAHRYRRYSMGGMTWDDYDIYVANDDGSNVPRLVTGFASRWLDRRPGSLLLRASQTPGMHGLSVTTSPDDRGRFVRCRKCPSRRISVDTRNIYPGKALGLPVSTLKSVDTRKSFPCKAVTTCRHFWGYLLMRASFAAQQTTRSASMRRYRPPSPVTSSLAMPSGRLRRNR